MALVLLILATVVDLALAALVVGVSGFIIGGGPESVHGGKAAEAAIAAAVAGCVLAPIIGFVLRSFGRPVGGILIAWLPPAAALLLMAVPAPY